MSAKLIREKDFRRLADVVLAASTADDTVLTPEFWNSCDGVANRKNWREYGFITCGKGQPGQSGWMTHAAAHGRFRQVNVMDPKGAKTG